MQSLFADASEAISNTEEVAEKCQFKFDFKKKYYPVFYPPTLETQEISKQKRQEEVAKYLYQLAKEAIEKKYTAKQLERIQKKYPDKDPKELVIERLEDEFSVISSKGMCDYFLIVYDFIDWAKKRNIPVGPGRGSVAGSIIAYLIGITDIEPLTFQLFFERFINPERISYPDIDVDICMDRRQEVIDYMMQKYGKEKVAQIITFGTMKAKMAIKDVGRVLSVSLSKVNAIAKLVPDELNITLDKALRLDVELKTSVKQIMKRNVLLRWQKKSKVLFVIPAHMAAGLIVSAEKITHHIPVCTAKDADMLVTQYAMKPVETVGMLKIDFLGLKTLTCIQKLSNISIIIQKYRSIGLILHSMIKRPFSY